MASIGGSNIVTNGLIFAVDAANQKSYVSGSTFWYDISGNNNATSLTLVSGSTYDTTNQGTIKFSGSSSFANISTVINFPTSTAFTLEGIITIPTFSQFASRAHWMSGVGGNSMVNIFSNQISIWNEAGGVNSLSIPATFIINTPYHIALTRDTSNNVILYVNGSNVGSGNRDGQFRWTTIARLGSTTSFCSVINISKINVYNRAITSSEVLQNYEALKSRYIY